MVNMLNLLSVPYTYSFVNISENSQKRTVFHCLYVLKKYIYFVFLKSWSPNSAPALGFSCTSIQKCREI